MKKIAIIAVTFFIGKIDGQAWFNAVATIEEVRADLESGKYDVDIRNEDGLTGLMLAAKNGDLGVTRMLLDYGAYVDARADDQQVEAKIYGDSGNTALQFVCLFGNNDAAEDIANELLARGAQTNVHNDTGDTPVHFIMWIQDQEKRMRILKALLAHGADMDAQNKKGHTMLHVTADANDRTWATTLKNTFGSVINFNIKNNQGYTPKQLALDHGQADMAETLSELAVPLGTDNVYERDVQQRTGLMAAIARNDINFARNQLKHLAQVAATDADGNTPMHYATLRKTEVAPFVTLLLDFFAPVNIENIKGMTPLHDAVLISSPEERFIVAGILVKAGAQLIQNREGNTPLHIAVSRHDTHLVNLFKGMAGVDARNRQGKTAQEQARDAGYTDIVRILTR